MKSKQQYIRFILVSGAIILWGIAFTDEKFTQSDPVSNFLQRAGTFVSYCDNALTSHDYTWLDRGYARISPAQQRNNYEH